MHQKPIHKQIRKNGPVVWLDCLRCWWRRNRGYSQQYRRKQELPTEKCRTVNIDIVSHFPYKVEFEKQWMTQLAFHSTNEEDSDSLLLWEERTWILKMNNHLIQSISKAAHKQTSCEPTAVKIPWNECTEIDAMRRSAFKTYSNITYK